MNDINVFYHLDKELIDRSSEKYLFFEEEILKLVTSKLTIFFTSNHFQVGIPSFIDLDGYNPDKKSIVVMFEPEFSYQHPLEDNLFKEKAIEIILSQPSIFCLLITFKSRKQLFAEINGQCLFTNLVSTDYNNLTSNLSWSFFCLEDLLQCNEINQITKTLPICLFSSYFDPSGLRRYLHDITYNMVNNPYEINIKKGVFNRVNNVQNLAKLKRPPYALIIDDDLEIALHHAYILYRMGYCCVIPQSYQDLLFIKSLILTGAIKLDICLVDEFLRFEDCTEIEKDFKGSEFLKDIGEFLKDSRKIIVTGGGKTQKYCINKPLIDVFQFSASYHNIKAKRIKGNIIDPLYAWPDYIKFPHHAGHSIQIKPLKHIYSILAFNARKLEIIMDLEAANIFWLDAYNIIKGRVGNYALDALFSLEKNEILSSSLNYPDITGRYIKSRLKEFDQFFKIAYEVKNSTQSLTISKSVSKRTLFKNLKTYSKKFFNYLFQRKIKDIIEIESINRKYSFLKAINRIFIENGLRSKYISDLRIATFRVSRDISINEKKYWLAFLKSIGIGLYSLLNRPSKLFVSWLFLLIITFLFYALKGEPCQNPFNKDPSLDHLTMSIFQAIAGGFKFGAVSEVNLCINGGRQMVLAIGIIHSCISYLLLIFLADYLIQRSKEI